jgi:rhodanese-related sulfurtransferase
MKWKNAAYAGVLIMTMIGMSLAAAGRAAEDAPRITKEEVKALLADTGVVILDARTGASWEGSDKKIKGAVRVDPDKVASWANSVSKDKKVVVYCS